MTSSLNLDSPAPSIKVQNWLRGDPLSNFQLGKIYIVEFFSTTCGYCEPELSDLAKLHKKFIDTGVSSSGSQHVRKLRRLTTPEPRWTRP